MYTAGFGIESFHYHKNKEVRNLYTDGPLIMFLMFSNVSVFQIQFEFCISKLYIILLSYQYQIAALDNSEDNMDINRVWEIEKI
jgi:hypothetical protein